MHAASAPPRRSRAGVYHTLLCRSQLQTTRALVAQRGVRYSI